MTYFHISKGKGRGAKRKAPPESSQPGVKLKRG